MYTPPHSLLRCDFSRTRGLIFLILSLLQTVHTYLDVALFQPEVMNAGTIVSSPSSPSGAQYELIERVRRVGSPTTGAIIAAPLQQLVTQASVSIPQLDVFESILYSESCSITGEAVVKSSGEVLGSREKDSAHYSPHEMAGRGHEGEVWRARRIDDGRSYDDEHFVIKRLYPGRAQRSGWREIHFGIEFRQVPGIARFVEYFTRSSSNGGNSNGGSTEASNDDLWLVFKDEGISLQSLLFSRIRGGSAVVATPFWVRLRTSLEGRAVFKKIAFSLIESLAAVHSRNRTLHRDIKPGNVLVGTESGALEIKIADFGSAVDDYSRNSLYDSDGPGVNEQTADYSPPETFYMSQPYFFSRPLSYDSFSVGVLLLEILLGQTASTIFSPQAKVEAILRKQFENNDDNKILLSTSLRIAGFLKLCIAPVPRDSTAAVLAARGAIARGGGAGSGRGGSDPLCGGLTGFRRALRELDALASQRADKLLTASTGTESSSSSSLSASSAYSVWYSGGTNGALVSLRNKEASVAAFGKEALVPWHPPPSPPLLNKPLHSDTLPIGLAGASPIECLINESNNVNTSSLIAPFSSSSSSLPTPSSSHDTAAAASTTLLGEDGEALLYQLLLWYPQDRLLPTAALQLDYFKSMKTENERETSSSNSQVDEEL